MREKKLTDEENFSIKDMEKELLEYFFMGCSYGAIVCGKVSITIAEKKAKEFAPIVYDFVKQAVKDTAKEIYKGLCKKWDKMKDAILFNGESENLKDLISEIIGVEVE